MRASTKWGSGRRQAGWSEKKKSGAEAAKDASPSTHCPLDQTQECKEEEKQRSLTNKGVGGPGTTYRDTEIVVLSL